MGGYVLFECGKCDALMCWPERLPDGHRCVRCGGWIQAIDGGTLDEMSRRHGDKDIVIAGKDAKRTKIDRVLYLCDHRACDRCGVNASECNHTSDIRHAKNFESICGVFMESEPPVEKNGN